MDNLDTDTPTRNNNPDTDTPPRNNGLQNLIDLLEAKVDDESISPAEMRVLADLYHRNGIELGLQIKASIPVPNLLPFGDVKEVNG